MRRTRLAITALLLLAAPSAAMAQAGEECLLPGETGARPIDGRGSGYLSFRTPGSEICIPRSSPGCFGCEPGYVHRCIDGGWQPLAERRCGGEGYVGAAVPPERDDAGRNTASDRDAAWPGSLDRQRSGPSGTVPFRHCRYFDGDGTELRIPAAEAGRARELGLVAWQRCETVFCRLYGGDGRPLYYAPDDQDLVREDIRSGHVSVRASECHASPRPTAGAMAGERR